MTLSNRQHGIIEWGGLFLGLLLMLGTLRYGIGSDGAVRYRMIQALVEQHRLTADPYSLLHGLFATPLYLLGKATVGAERACQRFNWLVYVLLLWVLYRRLRGACDAGLLRKWFLLLTFCSMFPYHLSQFFTEVLSVSLTVAGLVWLLTDAPLPGALALCLGTVDSPACLIPLTLVIGKLVWETRKPLYFAISLLSLLGILLESWVRRGSLFASGYGINAGLVNVLPYSGRPGFSYPLVLGAASLLFSFGKGVLFFAPGLFLRNPQAEESRRKPLESEQATAEPVKSTQPSVLQQLQALLWWYVAGLLLIYGSWWAWYGGIFWGPRFLLIASVPASLTLALHLQSQQHTPIQTLQALALTLLAGWVGVSGAVFGEDALRYGITLGPRLEPLMWYAPEFSPLWTPLLFHHDLSWRDRGYLAFSLGITLWLVLPLVGRLLAQIRPEKKLSFP